MRLLSKRPEAMPKVLPANTKVKATRHIYMFDASDVKRCGLKKSWVEGEDKSIYDLFSYGALLFGLEDEFPAVRLAALRSLGALSRCKTKFTEYSLPFILDMFHDGSPAVRLEAIEILVVLTASQPLPMTAEDVNNVISLMEGDLMMFRMHQGFIKSSADDEYAIRRAARIVLSRVGIKDVGILRTILNALLRQLKMYPGEKEEIYESVKCFGHVQQVLVQDWLSLKPTLLEAGERPRFDNDYIAAHLLIYGASLRNRVFLQYLKQITADHHVFLQQALPDLFTPVRISRADKPDKGGLPHFGKKAHNPTPAVESSSDEEGVVENSRIKAEERAMSGARRFQDQLRTCWEKLERIRSEPAVSFWSKEALSEVISLIYATAHLVRSLEEGNDDLVNWIKTAMTICEWMIKLVEMLENNVAQTDVTSLLESLHEPPEEVLPKDMGFIQLADLVRRIPLTDPPAVTPNTTTVSQNQAEFHLALDPPEPISIPPTHYDGNPGVTVQVSIEQSLRFESGRTETQPIRVFSGLDVHFRLTLTVNMTKFPSQARVPSHDSTGDKNMQKSGDHAQPYNQSGASSMQSIISEENEASTNEDDTSNPTEHHRTKSQAPLSHRPIHRSIDPLVTAVKELMPRLKVAIMLMRATGECLHSAWVDFRPGNMDNEENFRVKSQGVFEFDLDVLVPMSLTQQDRSVTPNGSKMDIDSGSVRKEVKGGEVYRVRAFVLEQLSIKPSINVEKWLTTSETDSGEAADGMLIVQGQPFVCKVKSQVLHVTEK